MSDGIGSFVGIMECGIINWIEQGRLRDEEFTL